MAESCIKVHYLDKSKRRWIYALSPSGGATFFDDCLRRDKQRLVRISKALARVFDAGVPWAKEAGVLKRIRGADVSVFEAKVGRTVIRVAAYLHNGSIPIYLFDFDTHSGSGNNLPQHYIEKASNMARTAKLVAETYTFYEEET